MIKPGWDVRFLIWPKRSNDVRFCCKLRRKNKSYSQTGSKHGSNRSKETNRVESGVKQERAMCQTGSTESPGSRSRSKTSQDMSGLSGFSARFERFGRFFLEKPLKPLKSCLKNRSLFSERSYKENRLKLTKRPGMVKWPGVDLHKPKMLILLFPTPKMLIIKLFALNVWKNVNHTIFIQF